MLTLACAWINVHMHQHFNAHCMIIYLLILRPWREPVNPYYANMGYARAPATSANDSEQQSMSSDADTLSLTDSSV